MTSLRRESDGIRVVGFDPSLRNWGIARALLLPPNQHNGYQLTVDHLDVIRAVVNKGKQVRQNSQDLDVAEQLTKAAVAAAQGAQAIFVEVPVGSQSARAMTSYGLCVGVLGALRAQGIPFFEVNPEEVKLATSGKKTATKADMIAWAMAKHPEAAWPMQTKKGITSVVKGSAEHMADAVAAIYAGLLSKSFQQALHFMQKAA